MDEYKICDNCGGEFFPDKYTKGRFCSKNCAITSFRIRKKKEVQEEIADTKADEFMDQPEITHLRAGIRIAIRTAYDRVHGRSK